MRGAEPMKQFTSKKGVIQGAVIQRLRADQGQKMPNAIQERHF